MGRFGRSFSDSSWVSSSHSVSALTIIYTTNNATISKITCLAPESTWDKIQERRLVHGADPCRAHEQRILGLLYIHVPCPNQDREHRVPLPDTLLVSNENEKSVRGRKYQLLWNRASRLPLEHSRKQFRCRVRREFIFSVTYRI
jgi:hypothetical protein